MAIKQLENGRWQADFRADGRGSARIRKTFKTKGEALRFLRIRQGELTKNPEFKPQQKDTRQLIDLIHDWYKYHGNTLKDGKLRYGKLQYICEAWGNPTARHITPESYLIFRKERIDGNTETPGVKYNTVNHDLTYLKSVFNKLIKLENWNAANPLSNIDKITIDQAEITYLSEQQIDQLDNYLTGDTKRITSICLSTGCRWSEAQFLRREQINDCKIQFSSTKNSLSRAVPIEEFLQSEILEGKPKQGRLFKTSIIQFTEAIKELEIELPKGQLTHVLRHSFAVHFMINRGNILDLQKILGHKTLSQTIRYAQFHPNYLSDAVTKNPLSSVRGHFVDTDKDTPNVVNIRQTLKALL